MTNHISADVVRTALAQMKPRPSVEMYPGDWLRDPISGCSLAANGLWWRMTMVMHDAKPYGHLVGNNGLALTEQQAAQRCGCRTVAEWRKALSEIEAVGIPGRTGDADYLKILQHEPIEIRRVRWTVDFSPLAIEPTGVIYSRRMLRDRILSLVRFLVSPRGQQLVVDPVADSSTDAEAEVRDVDAPAAVPNDKKLTPQQQAVGIVLDAFAKDLCPHPGLVARWISQMAEGRHDPNPITAAEAVREIVWKYPDKSAEYIGKCVGTAATKARSTKGTPHVTGKPDADLGLGRFKTRKPSTGVN